MLDEYDLDDNPDTYDFHSEEEAEAAAKRSADDRKAE